MPTNLQRNNFPFPFTNRLPLTNGKVSPETQYTRDEMERMYEALQEDMNLMFGQLVEQITASTFTIVTAAPVNSGAPGVHPSIFVDGTDVYVTIANNTWRKATLSIF